MITLKMENLIPLNTKEEYYYEIRRPLVDRRFDIRHYFYSFIWIGAMGIRTM